MKTGITTIAGLLGLGLLKRLGSKALVEVQTGSFRSIQVNYSFAIGYHPNLVDDVDVENRVEEALGCMIERAYTDYTSTDEGNEFIIRNISIYVNSEYQDQNRHDLNVQMLLISDFNAPIINESSEVIQNIKEDMNTIVSRTISENEDINYILMESDWDDVSYGGNQELPLIPYRFKQKKLRTV